MDADLWAYMLFVAYHYFSQGKKSRHRNNTVDKKKRFKSNVFQYLFDLSAICSNLFYYVISIDFSLGYENSVTDAFFLD